jgi:hypothetical protein
MLRRKLNEDTRNEIRDRKEKWSLLFI